MDSSVQFFKSNLQGADIVAAGERSLVTVCRSPRNVFLMAA